MARHLSRALAVLVVSFAGLGTARAETTPPPAEAPAIRVLEHSAPSDDKALTLGHSLTVTVCVPSAALAGGKPDLGSIGLMLGGVRVATKPVSVRREAGACAPVAAKPAEQTGTKIALLYQVDYERDPKDKKWVSIFESRIAEKTAVLGLADAAGREIKVEIDAPASTVYLRRLLWWEAWIISGIAGALVLLLLAAIAWSPLLRDSYNNLAGQWYAYLGAKFDAWAAQTFAATHESYEALRDGLRRLGVADPRALMEELPPRAAVAAQGNLPAQAARQAVTKADFFNRVTDLVDKVKPTYSLARFQMALWTIVILLGFLLMYLVTATLFEIPANVLVLMGVSGATYLGARVIDARPAAPAQAADVPPQRSVEFFTDMVVDERGVALHRVQMLLWTVTLVGIFIYEVLNRMVFTEFDNTLLGLMGISNGTYLALKAMEK